MNRPSPTGQSNLRAGVAEFVGTTVLMIIGPGSAIIASDKIGNYGIAFAFGLALLGMAYTIGHVSGCHINPAVTLGFLLSRKIAVSDAIIYWIAQLAGGALRWLHHLDHRRSEGISTPPASSPRTDGEPTSGASSVSAPLPSSRSSSPDLLVFVVLSTTTVGYPTGFGGLAAGLDAGDDPPGDDSGRQHVREPCSQSRHGGVLGNRRDEAALGVLRVPAGGSDRWRVRVDGRARHPAGARPRAVTSRMLVRRGPYRGHGDPSSTGMDATGLG